MQNFIITIEIYEVRIHILHEATDEEFNSYFSILTKEEPERLKVSATCWTFENKEGKETYLIDFRKKLKKDAASMNTIVHEATHATFAILEYVSIPYIFEKSEETYCYLVGYITEKIWEGLFHKPKI